MQGCSLPFSQREAGLSRSEMHKGASFSRPRKGHSRGSPNGAQGPNRGCFSYPFTDEQTGSRRRGQIGLQAPHLLALPSLPASPIHAQGLCAASTCFSPSVAMAGRPHTGLRGTEMLESWSEMLFVVAQTKDFTPQGPGWGTDDKRGLAGDPDPSGRLQELFQV